VLCSFYHTLPFKKIKVKKKRVLVSFYFMNKVLKKNFKKEKNKENQSIKI